MLFLRQRIISIVCAVFSGYILANIFLNLFIIPIFGYTSLDEAKYLYNGEIPFYVWIQNLYPFVFQIFFIVSIYLGLSKFFKYRNKVKYAKDWGKENSELKVTKDGEVYKEPDRPIVYTSIYQLINEPNIENMHYTTLFVEGCLTLENKNYCIHDSNQEQREYFIKAIFEETPPVIDNTVHRFKGTLMVENSQITLQWTKQVF